MLICVFSDIHGNGRACEAALPLMRKERADIYLFLGDLCGYYYDQRIILEMLLTLPSLVAVRGNHDQYYLDILNGDDALRTRYLERVGHSMENLLHTDCDGLRSWIAEQPLLLEDKQDGWIACHGLPDNPLEGRLYPDAQGPDLATEGASLVFSGHTHYKLDKRFGSKRILNPGSLGQPRDGRHASYALMNTDTGASSFREIPFDRDHLKGQIDSAGDGHLYLRSILDRFTDAH